MRRVVQLAGMLLVVASAMLSGNSNPLPAVASGTANVFSSPDSMAFSGMPTSLALDGAGRPVVAYYSSANDLKILRCGDATCSTGNSIVAVDTVGDVGAWRSLALDSLDNPVVSYYDATNMDLKLLHCGTPTCSSGNSITSPVTTGTVGLYTSLELDSAGNPVVSYIGVPSLGEGDLNILHCNDPDCTGGDESMETPDSSDASGPTSLELDASGFPVVAYGSTTVLRCNDPDCAGGDETSAYSAMYGPSLALSGAGNPLISGIAYAVGYKAGIVECGNAICSGSTQPVLLDDATSVSDQTSLMLDSGGAPVVAYYDDANKDLKIARCGSVSCKAGVSVATPDALGNVGKYASLALDASGNPVVSYFDETRMGLKVLHCGNPGCSSGNAVEVVYEIGPGGGVSLALDSAGAPVVSYNDDGDLLVTRCGDPACGNGNSRSVISSTSSAEGTSVDVEAGDRPVVAYNGPRILRCGNLTCSAGNSIEVLDSGGAHTSLKLDATDAPVVAYFDTVNGDLKVLHCNDPACSGGDESIEVVDAVGVVGSWTSLSLDAFGNPVVSYYDVSGEDIKVLHCNDPDCSGSDESITSPDMVGDVGAFSSLALDGSGDPVVSYLDGTNADLKVMHCNDPDCAGADESIVSPDQGGEVGRWTSIVLDGSGKPVVAYYDKTNADIKIIACGDANCASGNIVSSAERAGDVGEFASIALAPSGLPVVAYVERAQENVRILFCTTPACPEAPDTDGDGCPDTNEQQSAPGTELSGGRRSPKNPNDYFDASHNGQVRINDIVLVVQAYFKDDNDGNPGLPPYVAGYNPNYDRVLPPGAPHAWSLQAGNGLQRVDDILNEVHQYFHDCA